MTAGNWNRFNLRASDLYAMPANIPATAATNEFGAFANTNYRMHLIH